MLHLASSLAGPVEHWTPVAVAFSMLLLVACVTDVRERRIPNLISGLLLMLGLGSALVTGGLSGLAWGLLSAAAGLLVWLPFYVAGRLGAGDVKLFAAAASGLSPLAVVDAAFLAAFAGGLLALLWMMAESGVAAGLLRAAHAARYQEALVADPGDRRRKLPYGVAMGVGLALTLLGVTVIGR
jgi:prepilin peptidase CpaA